MNAPNADTLHWTSDAVEAIRDLRRTEGRGDAAFRVDVRLGGCQGFKVYFELDESHDDDLTFDCGDGVRIVVQEDGMPLIAGGVLDYEDSHRGHGFRMASPRAEKSCGCGQAFYANLEAEADEASVAADADGASAPI